MTEEQTKELRVALLNFVARELRKERPEEEILILPKIARTVVESGLLQKEFADAFRVALLEFVVQVANKPYSPYNSYRFRILPEIVKLLVDFDSLYPN